jgi:hypothetical protein
MDFLVCQGACWESSLSDKLLFTVHLYARKEQFTLSQSKNKTGCGKDRTR